MKPARKPSTTTPSKPAAARKAAAPKATRKPAPEWDPDLECSEMLAPEVRETLDRIKRGEERFTDGPTFFRQLRERRERARG